MRGPNYQEKSLQQAKIVRCIRGSLFSVGININPDSTNFGKCCGFILSSENNYVMYISRTYAHGFVTLEDDTELEYFTDKIYNFDSEKSIAWNDPDVGIDWSLGGNIDLKKSIMSEKNKMLLDKKISYKDLYTRKRGINLTRG